MKTEQIQEQGTVKKTGTTIVGIKYKDGLMLFTDTRSTMGDIVENKTCTKLHYLSPTMYCAGAGTAADTDRVTRMTEKYLNLFRNKYNREGSVFTAKRILSNHLHYYCGYVGAALILGGKHNNDYYLFDIHPHGSCTESLYTSLGSGSLAAMSYLERMFKINMTEEEAIDLGIKAIEAGIMNDLYSGTQVDYLIIKDDGAKYVKAAKICAARENVNQPITLDKKIEILEEEIIHLND
ncbi:hypothetical protein H312_01883 [Anncaliia algerae PRA339]|uniref:Proteasome endopeptidase complex n=1 Tax=Anncaliia algerae PRA339 TaxID=1288291 RepID=A0A059F0M8_9MICR|nr:hypothetical protein H312_01883 [Anncaliia algerae PRA339]